MSFELCAMSVNSQWSMVNGKGKAGSE